jgi:DNA mismatch endonuclease, patch repair protein
MDVHNKATRSFNMSRIRGKNTKPEVQVRQLCHRAGLRFRLNRKDLPGKPDLVFPKYRTVLFVHGCFWHSHDCKYGKVTPKTRAEFWAKKRSDTVSRDQRAASALCKDGWRVLAYWECELRDAVGIKDRIGRDFDVSSKIPPLHRRI